ncbi:uncharacterized protein LOC129870292 [Solanum dulcamara]|uniref:uncharacterized protein LOC129870292 n=1 Tax=Solanum dulcamara TaxID=45834 RepID=UPI0024866D95|nr:uncharacterized protein LOC129870292 [Solanum dulcamara]
MFFDGASNSKGVGIGAVLISEKGQYYPISAKIRFDCTNNMAEYEACILGLRMAIDMNVKELLVIGDSDLLVHQVLGEWATKNVKILPYLHCIKGLSRKFTSIEFKHVPRAQNEFADALATISSMIQHPDKNYIDPIKVKLHDRHAYCFHVVEEMDGRPWYYDIKRLIEAHEYPENATSKLKRTLRKMANHFFLNGEILYMRTPNLGLLRCVDAKKAMRLLEEIYAGTCGPHMNGFTLAKKILRAGYFWMTMERDSIRYVQKCHQCQVHGDFIRVPPNELNIMGSPWPFSAWGMDVIGPIEPPASNGHRFILVAIDYFTKWVEASTYKAVTKKVVADFVRNNIICRFGIPESIITDNAANLNSDLIKEICERFKIAHRNSTTYRPQMNGAVEAANKNIKKILRKIVDEAVIPAEVEIPSLRIIQEVGLDDAEWIHSRIEQLMLIDEKRMDAFYTAGYRRYFTISTPPDIGVTLQFYIAGYKRYITISTPPDTGVTLQFYTTGYRRYIYKFYTARYRCYIYKFYIAGYRHYIYKLYTAGCRRLHYYHSTRRRTPHYYMELPLSNKLEQANGMTSIPSYAKDSLSKLNYTRFFKFWI